jgi:hypothetical protein
MSDKFDFGLNLLDINEYNKLCKAYYGINVQFAVTEAAICTFLLSKHVPLYSRVRSSPPGCCGWKTEPYGGYASDMIFGHNSSSSCKQNGGVVLGENATDDEDQIYFTTIAIRRPFDEQQYINYFTTEDFNCDKLEQLLKTLTSDQLALNDSLIKSSIPTENSVPHPISEDTLKYNSLLQKYCVELIIICKTYTFEQSHKDAVELKFEFPL